MEIDNITEVAHHGHDGKSVRRIRGIVGISQADLAIKIDMQAPKLSKLEKMKEIPTKDLAKIAEGLGVSVEFIRNFDSESTVNYIFSNNTFSGESSSIGNHRYNQTVDNRTINPLEKVTELYERILELERKLAYYENREKK